MGRSQRNFTRAAGPEGCSGFAGPCRRRRMFPLMSGHARCTLEGMGWRRRWITRTVLPTLPSNITGDTPLLVPQIVAAAATTLHITTTPFFHRSKLLARPSADHYHSVSPARSCLIKLSPPLPFRRLTSAYKITFIDNTF